jgi:hypothetical protein
MKKLPEIIKPADIQDETKKFRDIAQVELSSVQGLLELAETLDIPVVFQAGKKKYMFVYENMKFIAKQ